MLAGFAHRGLAPRMNDPEVVRTLVGASLVRLLADGEGHVAVFDHVLNLAAH